MYVMNLLITHCHLFLNYQHKTYSESVKREKNTGAVTSDISLPPGDAYSSVSLSIALSLRVLNSSEIAAPAQFSAQVQ